MNPTFRRYQGRLAMMERILARIGAESRSPDMAALARHLALVKRERKRERGG